MAFTELAWNLHRQRTCGGFPVQHGMGIDTARSVEVQITCATTEANLGCRRQPLGTANSLCRVSTIVIITVRHGRLKRTNVDSRPTNRKGLTFIPTGTNAVPQFSPLRAPA